MMKTKKMKLAALLVAAIMVFMLTGCEVSSSSSSTTTVTTSTTDADGNTTTNTTTTEVGVEAGSNGVTTTNQTTTETTTTSAEEAAEAEDEWAGLKDHLRELYNVGAEGTNADGDKFYYAYNDADGDSAALLVIVSADEAHYNGWEGMADVVDDHVVLTSDDQEVPYTFEDNDGGFTLTFLNDGDVATMQFVDFDTFVDNLVAARAEFTAD